MDVDHDDEPVYEIIRECPECGPAHYTQLKRLQCAGPRTSRNGVNLNTDDWESEDDYDNQDCKDADAFDRVEYVETLCGDVPAAAPGAAPYAECSAHVATECSDTGDKWVVVDGEAFLTACEQRKMSS